MEDGGEKERLRCPACGWTHWNNPTPVLAAVIECADRDGRVLLARNAAWTGRMFALITGFMEAGETPEHGIAREVIEETALQVDALKLIGVYDFQRMNQVIIAYHALARGEVRLSPELADYKLFDPADSRLLAGRHRLCAGRLAARSRARADSSSSSGGARRMAVAIESSAMQAKELDTRGLNCPLPILKAKKALADMQSGEVLKVRGHRPGLDARLPGLRAPDRQRAGRAEQPRPTSSSTTCAGADSSAPARRRLSGSRSCR